LEEARKAERAGRYPEAAQMYGQLIKAVSLFPTTDETIDVNNRSITGVARCANKSGQYDQAIDIMKQVTVDSDSPAYMRATLAFSYLMNGGRCCSSRYKNGIGIPLNKNEAKNMQSWVEAAAELEPAAEDVTELLGQSYGSLNYARKYHLSLQHPLLFIFGLLLTLLYSGLYFFQSSQDFRATVLEKAGEHGSTLTKLTETATGLVGKLPADLPYPALTLLPLWFATGLVLFLVGSLRKGYMINRGTRRNMNVPTGILALAFFPIYSFFRLLGNLFGK